MSTELIAASCPFCGGAAHYGNFTEPAARCVPCSTAFLPLLRQTVAAAIKAELAAGAAKGGDGATETASEATNVDRAQQGEPVATSCGFWRARVEENAADVAAEHVDMSKMYDEFRRLKNILKTPGYCDGTKYTERQAFYMAIATKAAAPADALKDHEIREAVNTLRDIAIKYHAAGQLREQIAYFIVPLLRKTPAVAAQEQQQGGGAQAGEGA